MTKLMSSPLQRAMYTAKAVQTFQALAGHKPPQAVQSAELTNRDWGEWDGQPASEVRFCNYNNNHIKRPFRVRILKLTTGTQL